MATRHRAVMARVPASGAGPGRIEQPRLVYGVIAACTALFLRLYQLSRPGYLLGVTEYDDGALFGNAVRLANGAIPYRDFAVVQPPGSIVLIAPVALLAKVTGTAWGLGIARILTVVADSACVALLGLLVRHRGALAAGVASGVYAVYPDALRASHTFLLEPWLNLFCLVGALLVFDGDRMAGSRRRLVFGGVALGFAVAIKLWAVIPLAIIALLLARWPRRVAALAAGAAAGLIIPVLLIVAVAVVAGYMVLCFTAGRPPAPLDWYALTGALAVLFLFLWPQLYYPHYGAFEGPFLALVLALPIGLLRPAASGTRLVTAVAVGMLAAILIAGVSLWQFGQMAHLKPLEPPLSLATADQLIPPGSCVVTNEASLTIAANRFVSNVPGCPSVVDSYGAFLAMTTGDTLAARPRVLRSAVRIWEAWLARADYLWIDPMNNGDQLPWTPAFYSYITSHFTLIALASSRHPKPNVPRAGLYERR